MTDQRTLVTFLLDRSGSMEYIKDDTIGAFNGYLEGLQQDGDLIDFTLVQFDSQGLDKVCVRVPVAQAVKLNKQNFQPRGGTPLIDAAYKTIKAVEASLNGKNPRVVVSIQTDGQENSSTEHTWDELNALIKEKTALGWQFNFLGTGIDAYQQGARMGVAAMNIVSSGMTPQNIQASYGSLAAATTRYSTGASQDTSLTAGERSASGDAYAHKVDALNLGGAQPQTPTPHVTLTTPAAAKPKSQAVDDFTL